MGYSTDLHFCLHVVWQTRPIVHCLSKSFTVVDHILVLTNVKGFKVVKVRAENDSSSLFPVKLTQNSADRQF